MIYQFGSSVKTITLFKEVTMSNEINDEIMEQVRDRVSEVWQLPSRPDLEQDCIEYVYTEYLNYEWSMTYLVIKFLSKHCSQAVSSQDLKHMAGERR